MATFCIPKHLVEDLKKSAIKGEIKLQELADMSTAERRAHFEKFTDKETSKFLNTEFEKAIASKQQGAMLDWAKSVFSPKAQKEASFKNVIGKINEMDKQGILTPTSEKAFLQDLVAEKLGITVSPAEVKAIAERAKKIDEAQVALGPNLGDPRFADENIKFLTEKANMDKYLESLTPASKTKVFTGTIGRGAMLASVKSPVLNIGSNLLLSIPEAIGRRVGNRALKGADNKKALDYVKFVNKVYQKTGYDLSRMTSLNDTGASGARVLGDTVHSQGKGAVRKIGRIMEDIVFKQLMGAPDVAFSAAHFADSVNLGALDMAKSADYAKKLKTLEGAEKQAFIEATKKEAKDIMTDAMRIEPQTAKGELLRAQAIMDAQVATFTNDTWASKASLGIRKVLNDITGDVRGGDLTMPFVKTPANVVATGIDYAGGGAVKALIDTVNTVRGGNIKSKAYMHKLGRDLTRAGFGITAAVVIASNLDKDDFSGAYDPSRAQNSELKNKVYNAFKIGDKWVSADWFGVLAEPLVAIMYAKKYGRNKEEGAMQYAKSVASSLTRLPGVETVASLYDDWSEKGYMTRKEMTDKATDDAIGFLASRMVPSIFSDIAKMIDPYERKTGKGLDSLKARIPGLRQSLPAKVNIFGDEIEGEHPLSELLFGARVKTDRTTDLIRELDTVAEASGEKLNFTDWNRTTSKKVGQFKGSLEPAEFEIAKRKYGQNLKKEVEKVMASNAYKIANDEKKAKLINDADTDAMDQTFKEYGFKYDKDLKTIPEDKPVSENTLIGRIILNAKALKVDPITYFNRVFTGEKIRRVDNNTIIVERMPVSESQALKKAGNANTPDFKLDHTIPLVLGGSNSEDNLKIISTEEWKRNTPVEVKLGNLLKDGTIDRKEAQKLIKEFKEGRISADEIMNMGAGKQSNLGVKGKVATLFEKAKEYKKKQADLFMEGLKQDMAMANAKANGDTSQVAFNQEAADVYNDSLMGVAGITSGVGPAKALAKGPGKALAKSASKKLGEVLKAPLRIFHTTSADVKEKILKDGFKKGSELAEDAYRGGGYGQVQDSISFSTTKKSSSIFGINSKNTMFSTTLKKGSKVIDLPNVESAEELNEFIPKLLKDGVDAVRIGSGEDEVVIISKKAIGSIDEVIDFKATDAKDLFKGTAEKAKRVVLPKAAPKTAPTIPRSAINSGSIMGDNVRSKLLDELAKVPGVSPAEIQKALPRFGSVNYRKATESITSAIKKSRPNATNAEIEDIIYKALSRAL